MKRILAFTCLAAALSLGACAENNAAEETAGGETTATETETVAVPAASETTVVREVEGDTDQGDRVSIGEDGVQADVEDGNTRVRADVDGDPSLTVETD